MPGVSLFTLKPTIGSMFIMAFLNCAKSDKATVLETRALYLWYSGRAIDAKTPIMAIIIINSIRVKPALFFIIIPMGLMICVLSLVFLDSITLTVSFPIAASGLVGKRSSRLGLIYHIHTYFQVNSIKLWLTHNNQAFYGILDNVKC